MLACWLFGHRYDYELKRGGELSLICTKCGKWRNLINIEVRRPSSAEMQEFAKPYERLPR